MPGRGRPHSSDDDQLLLDFPVASAGQTEECAGDVPSDADPETSGERRQAGRNGRRGRRRTEQPPGMHRAAVGVRADRAESRRPAQRRRQRAATQPDASPPRNRPLEPEKDGDGVDVRRARAPASCPQARSSLARPVTGEPEVKVAVARRDVDEQRTAAYVAAIVAAAPPLSEWQRHRIAALLRAASAG